jgi:hypothetical protein
MKILFYFRQIFLQRRFHILTPVFRQKCGCHMCKSIAAAGRMPSQTVILHRAFSLFQFPSAPFFGPKFPAPRHPIPAARDLSGHQFPVPEPLLFFPESPVVPKAPTTLPKSPFHGPFLVTRSLPNPSHPRHLVRYPLKRPTPLVSVSPVLVARSPSPGTPGRAPGYPALLTLVA